MENTKYLATCPQLPTTAPLGHPHLIKIESVDLDYPLDDPWVSIPDLVVTILFKHKPETLARFLDMTHDFKFHPKHKSECGTLDFCIVRKGTTVTCGYLTETAMRGVQLWDSQHVYCLDHGPVGKWTPVVWKAYPGLEETTKGEILEVGCLAVGAPLMDCVWEERDTVEIVVEDSCAL